VSERARIEDGVERLRGDLEAGALSREQVLLAARLGDAAARDLLGRDAPALVGALRPWAEAIARESPAAGARLALAAGRGALHLWERGGGSPLPGRALAAAAAALEVPSRPRAWDLEAAGQRARDALAGAPAGPSAAAAAVVAAAEVVRLAHRDADDAALATAAADAVAQAAEALAAADEPPGVAEARVRAVVAADVAEWVVGRPDPAAVVFAGDSLLARSFTRAGPVARAIRLPGPDGAPPRARSAPPADPARLAALLGDVAARDRLGSAAPGLPVGFEAWAAEVCVESALAGVRLAVAAARAALIHWDRAFGVGRPHRAVAAAAAGLRCPCARHAAEAKARGERAANRVARGGAPPARLAARAAASAALAVERHLTLPAGRAELPTAAAVAAAVGGARQAFVRAGLSPTRAAARLRLLAAAEVRDWARGDRDALRAAGEDPEAHARDARAAARRRDGRTLGIALPNYAREELRDLVGPLPAAPSPRARDRVRPAAPTRRRPEPAEPEIVFDDVDPSGDGGPPLPAAPRSPRFDPRPPNHWRVGDAVRIREPLRKTELGEGVVVDVRTSTDGAPEAALVRFADGPRAGVWYSVGTLRQLHDLWGRPIA